MDDKINPILSNKLKSLEHSNLVQKSIDEINQLSSDNNLKKSKKNKNLIKYLKWKKRVLKKKIPRKERAAKKSSQTIHNSSVKTKDIHEQQTKALNYLKQWETDQSQWKFRKLQQAWLINNIFDVNLVPKEEFRIFKSYIKKLTGSAKTELLKHCTERIEKEATSSLNDVENKTLTNDNDDSDPVNKQVEIDKVSKKAVKRARRLFKILSKSDE